MYSLFYVAALSEPLEESIDFGINLPALGPGRILYAKDMNQPVLLASGPIHHLILQTIGSKQVPQLECVTVYQILRTGNEKQRRQLLMSGQSTGVKDERQIRLVSIFGIGDHSFKERQQVVAPCIQHDRDERRRPEPDAGRCYAEGMSDVLTSLYRRGEQS